MKIHVLVWGGSLSEPRDLVITESARLAFNRAEAAIANFSCNVEIRTEHGLLTIGELGQLAKEEEAAERAAPIRKH